MARRPPSTPRLAVIQPALIDIETTELPADRRSRHLRLPDLHRWIRRQLSWIAARSGAAPSQELFLYQQAAKLVEEVGELHAELLGRSKLQRAGKLQGRTSASLADEVADVLICTLILAEAAGVDVDQALLAKMAVVDERVAQAARTAPEHRLGQAT